jgi:hypothetical protein
VPLGNLTSVWPSEGVLALHVLGNGDVLAGGAYLSLSPVGPLESLARWDGTAWTAMGTGVVSYVTDIDVLPDGDWLVTHAGRDASGQPLPSPVRWNGTTWTPVLGLDIGIAEAHGCLAITDAGEVVCTGTFGSVQGLATGGLAALLAGCPATAAPVGNGCSGSAGPVALALRTRPWLGDAYRARTTGLPSLCIAVEVFGFAAVSLPLAAVLPQGVPGCTLHVSPDVLLATLSVTGDVPTSLSIPIAPSLIGQSFRHQVVPFELAPSGAITALTASNALLLTIGAW